MSQAGYTPIQLYYSTTAAAVPVNTNLANGELAINITDGKLYYKDNTGTVKLLAGATAGPAGGSNTQVQYNSSGVLAGSANMTFNGTTLTVNDLTDSSLTATRVTYAGTAGNLVDSANLTFDGTNLTVGGSATATRFIPSGSTVATNGMYLPAANSLGFSTNSTNAIYIDSGQRIGIGGSPSSGSTVWNIKNITGSTTSIAYDAVGTVMSDVTSSASGYRTSISTTASAFTLTSLNHFSANQSTIGASSAVTNQIGFNVGSSLTGATNNYGFYGAIASGTGRYNLYMAGTADNYLAGSLGIGTTAIGGTTGYTGIRIATNLSGATSAFGLQSQGVIQSDVTTGAYMFRTAASTAASAFTLPTLVHYDAAQGAIGATSTVTNQYGFVANSSLTGATNNFGFYSAVSSGTGRWNFYANGTAANYFAGNTQIASFLDVTTNTGAGFGLRVRADSADTYAGIQFTNTAASAQWAKIVSPATNVTAFQDSGSNELMRVNTTGLGIGTNAPGSKLDVKGTLRLSGSTSGYVGLAPAAAAGSTTYTLPSTDGSSGQFLSTNGSGTLSWATGGGGGGGTPGGSNTQVQYNSSGSFAGSANFTFNGTGISTGNVNVTSATNPTAGMYYNSTATSGLSFYNTGVLGGSSIIQAYYGKSTIPATTNGVSNGENQWLAFGSGATPNITTIGSTASLYTFAGHSYAITDLPSIIRINAGSRGDNTDYQCPADNGVIFVNLQGAYGGNAANGRAGIFVKQEQMGLGGNSTTGYKAQLEGYGGGGKCFWSLCKPNDPNGGGQPFGFYAQIDTSNGIYDNSAPVGLVIDNATVDNYTKTNGGAQMAIFYDRRSGSTTRTAIQFYRNTTGNSVGTITTTNTATAYNTSSDYRLKENIAPLTGAIEKVLRLKPSTYTWKVDGAVGEGFIAHELQEVIPQAVSGEKDAEKLQQVEVEHAVAEVQDADGNIVSYGKAPVYEEKMMPVYQGVDSSFLVATLTAAIQEQQALIVALTARVEALEAK